ncbi:LOW QUALITY PROTEIN: pleckstrin homology domain-containing family N member 1 [Bufo gargarizans]|uniref:LOW QUALITY PROTEIN: pleckstrin homology domain-containing family N member 1 n=1 Tax=Bufo gargarizans TaxID=30331 RepID=UPI001CF4C13E|nr:LOW QUALITY PROTEIN: pleckstrin homology domain-containing family N member 1 [Bufo gargarizans]
MGNLSCVPQPHRPLRYSFSRKNSVQGKEQDSRTKWTYLFGNESGAGRVTHKDNILHYIPGKDIGNDLQKDHVDQRFLSIFRKGKKKTIVRNMGQMIHYSKVKFRFQNSQDISDCYLEMFQSHLYFQSRGPAGLTYQGLVPLKELSVYKLERSKVPPKPEEEHAFRITGPLLNPLIVYCPTPQELQKWLYHLEKQIQLNGGNLDTSPVTEVNNANVLDKSELRKSVQSQHVQDWEGTQRESLGAITCISKVKLQTLPFQELNDRVLVLYPSTLVILSEEGKTLSFKGELPLKAIRVITDDNEKQRKSFLLEGRYINTIRVICLNQQDFDEWIDHLKNAQAQNRDSSLSASSSFCGSHSAHHEQVTASCRSSFTSDGRTKSWASGGKLGNSNPHSNSTTQGSDRQSYTILNEQNVPEDPLSPGYSQPVHCLANPNWHSGLNGPSDLKRGGSVRGSKGKKNLCLQIQSMPHSYDIENTGFGLIPETPSEDVLSPLYKEPYSYQKSHTTVTPQDMLNRWNLADSQQTTSQSDNQALSSLYAEPYTPTGQTSSNFMEEILRSLNTNGTEIQAPNVKSSGSFHVSNNAHPPLQKIYSHPVKGSHQLVKPMLHRNSEPDTSLHSRLVPAAQTPFFKSLSSVKAEMSFSQRNKEVEEMFDLPSSSSLQTETLDHDYAELQSFQSDFSYDNIWDYEVKEKDLNQYTPPSYPGHNLPGFKGKTVPSRWL